MGLVPGSEIQMICKKQNSNLFLASPSNDGNLDGYGWIWVHWIDLGGYGLIWVDLGGSGWMGTDGIDPDGSNDGAYVYFTR